MDAEIFRNMLCVVGRLPCGGECTVLYVRVYNDGYGRNDGSFIMVKLMHNNKNSYISARNGHNERPTDFCSWRVGWLGNSSI